MGRVTKAELSKAITEIMLTGNLDELTTKKIRILCEKKYHVDLTSRKQEIDDIVMTFINKHCNNGKIDKTSKSDDSSSYESDSSGSSEGSESECSKSSDKKSHQPAVQVKSDTKKPAVQSPAKSSVKKAVPMKPVPAKKATKAVSPQAKKQAVAAVMDKKSKDSAKTVLEDAAYARQLQAEEFNFRRRTVNQLFRNIPAKKSDKNDEAKRKRASPFMRKCLLSPALAEILGTSEMSRPDIVQKMCSVIRERDLFDTSNKQYAICDEQLFKLFGKKRIRIIGMMKYLKQHVKDVQ